MTDTVKLLSVAAATPDNIILQTDAAETADGMQPATQGDALADSLFKLGRAHADARRCGSHTHLLLRW